MLTDIQVTEIAKYPDVLSIQENQDDEKIKFELLKVVEEATDNLIDMRKAEGEKIAEDLNKRLDIIQEKNKRARQIFYWTY